MAVRTDRPLVGSDFKFYIADNPSSPTFTDRTNHVYDFSHDFTQDTFDGRSIDEVHSDMVTSGRTGSGSVTVKKLAANATFWRTWFDTDHDVRVFRIDPAGTATGRLRDQYSVILTNESPGFTRNGESTLTYSFAIITTPVRTAQT